MESRNAAILARCNGERRPRSTPTHMIAMSWSLGSDVRSVAPTSLPFCVAVWCVTSSAPPRGVTGCLVSESSSNVRSAAVYPLFGIGDGRFAHACSRARVRGCASRSAEEEHEHAAPTEPNGWPARFAACSASSGSSRSVARQPIIWRDSASHQRPLVCTCRGSGGKASGAKTDSSTSCSVFV